ncbi:unnamed protein product [Clonostachys rosea f. rosea IK726]|uniref:Uncharacterized protein n=2 Tax=Bionectria ochroleuca TaxID=29856 RepID=A0A0B7K184_BIOOC|nr:unnamed protein product [Clonostachys rosea f. rosea IK726]
MVLQTGLEGTHVIITGGSRGIGKSIVEAFLSEGANVSYCARNVTGDEFATFSSAHNARAVGTSVDVGDKAALQAWVKKSGESFGRIDTIIGNGRAHSMSALSLLRDTLTRHELASLQLFDDSSESWLTSYNVDVMGFVTLVQTAVPFLLKSPNASIVVISSFLGREFFRSPPAPYGPFKAAQLQHVQELSHYLGPKGIRTNAISPGPIIFPGGNWETYQKESPEWVEETRLKVPLRRLGSPEEIANAAVWLASRLSSYVSGTNMLVDGGIHVGTHF